MMECPLPLTQGSLVLTVSGVIVDLYKEFCSRELEKVLSSITKCELADERSHKLAKILRIIAETYYFSQRSPHLVLKLFSFDSSIVVAAMAKWFSLSQSRGGNDLFSTEQYVVSTVFEKKFVIFENAACLDIKGKNNIWGTICNIRENVVDPLLKTICECNFDDAWLNSCLAGETASRLNSFGSLRPAPGGVFNRTGISFSPTTSSGLVLSVLSKKAAGTIRRANNGQLSPRNVLAALMTTLVVTTAADRGIYTLLSQCEELVEGVPAVFVVGEVDTDAPFDHLLRNLQERTTGERPPSVAPVSVGSIWLFECAAKCGSILGVEGSKNRSPQLSEERKEPEVWESYGVRPKRLIRIKKARLVDAPFIAPKSPTQIEMFLSTCAASALLDRFYRAQCIREGNGPLDAKEISNFQSKLCDFFSNEMGNANITSDFTAYNALNTMSAGHTTWMRCVDSGLFLPSEDDETQVSALTTHSGIADRDILHKTIDGARETLLQLLNSQQQLAARTVPPKQVLFVRHLNSVTTARGLAACFSHIGTIVSVSIVSEPDPGYEYLRGAELLEHSHSLCYGFVEFSSEKECDYAYNTMENVRIDDSRIHVDFCQSTAGESVQQKKMREFMENGGNEDSYKSRFYYMNINYLKKKKAEEEMQKVLAALDSGDNNKEKNQGEATDFNDDLKNISKRSRE